nr:PREDICTED: 26S proteasome non-ATPase regulatory subunit 13-like isoform X2 [Latimeria chalumnae]|eukprot:XP_014347525.1 PREDICTED: 26S proteasome non-ATPase regulatory subunit 13-like isoform X2 [Latimeria chalumnae]
METVVSFLRKQEEADRAETEQWRRFENFYNQRLWHQLTTELLECIQRPNFRTGDRMIKLYENFIIEFEHRINPLSLMEIILVVVQQISDPEQALVLLEKTQEKVKSNEEAIILCQTAIVAIKLKLKEFHSAKKILEETAEILEKLPEVTTVHSRYYDISSTYFQMIRDHASYYREALRYLGCTDLKDLTVLDQQERAIALGLAALLGEGVYNFGELLMHPILQSLHNMEHQWLVDTLKAFNSGNVDAFFILKGFWSGQMVFSRPAHHRKLTFQEISSQAKLPLKEIELLVMKALSQGLIKGTINEVEQQVHVTWVQPRVMDLQQVRTMKKHLENWCQDVKKMLIATEEQAQEIIG